MAKLIDLTEQRFGRLVVKTRAPRDREVLWECVCDCGSVTRVRTSDLRKGHTKSCGCSKKPHGSIQEGQRFHNLIAVRDAGIDPRAKKRLWEFLCDCGKVTTKIAKEVQSGHTKSCGCRKKVHGQATQGSQSSTYVCWTSMIQRCTNPNHRDYADYGGRGITVCDRWLHSFENFYADMGDRPEGLSLDRIENNAGYSPENCRWATWREQHNNKRNNRFVEFEGRVQTIGQWAVDLGLTYSTVWGRVKRGRNILTGE